MRSFTRISFFLLFGADSLVMFIKLPLPLYKTLEILSQCKVNFNRWIESFKLSEILNKFIEKEIIIKPFNQLLTFQDSRTKQTDSITNFLHVQFSPRRYKTLMLLMNQPPNTQNDALFK